MTQRHTVRTRRVDAAFARTVGMFCLIVAEVGDLHHFCGGLPLLFGKSVSGPTPRQVLGGSASSIRSACFRSSLTIHFAERALRTRQWFRFKASGF